MEAPLSPQIVLPRSRCWSRVFLGVVLWRKGPEGRPWGRERTEQDVASAGPMGSSGAPTKRNQRAGRPAFCTLTPQTRVRSSVVDSPWGNLLNRAIPFS